jgi:MFS family permease
VQTPHSVEGTASDRKLTQPLVESLPVKSRKAAVLAWLVAAVFFFYQYALRSAPSAMMSQLSAAFGISTLAVASISGIFYYGYSAFSLVAGAAMDELGPRKVLPIAAAVVGIGAFLFATGDSTAVSIGRFLQGAGAVFAPVGAIYIAMKYFPASQAATLIGATQMFGMAGGSAGQFFVGPMISAGLTWRHFWVGLGIAGLLMGIALSFLLPKKTTLTPSEGWLRAALDAIYRVFRNRQSRLCGFIAGLLFIPTTIFDMIWGIQYLQEAHGFDYGTAVLRSATVPLGWIIGCPLFGYISDRLGKRKPVIIGGALLLLICFIWILFGRPGVFPPYVIGLLAGVASGAAMIPYTVIKESNPPEFSGTATGVINFINFTFSALMAPAFAQLLQRVSRGAEQKELAHYQIAFSPMLGCICLAIVLALLLKETGPATAIRSQV